MQYLEKADNGVGHRLRTVKIKSRVCQLLNVEHVTFLLLLLTTVVEGEEGTATSHVNQSINQSDLPPVSQSISK